MEATGRTADEIMDIMRVPDVVRSIYRKAVAIHKESDEYIPFGKLVTYIFKGLRRDLEGEN